MRERLIRVLEGGKSLVARGWTQHVGRNAAGERCAGQGLHDAFYAEFNWELTNHPITQQQEAWNELSRVFMQAIHELHPDLPNIISVPEWNDMNERTHDEVLAVFDRALKIAGKEDGPITIPPGIKLDPRVLIAAAEAEED